MRMARDSIYVARDGLDLVSGVDLVSNGSNGQQSSACGTVSAPGKVRRGLCLHAEVAVVCIG